jgi:bifunctional enzyme CysN/CysC
MAAEAFLEQYRDRELLRFLTCGSVDDGKSTLIGRLLYDSKTIYDDHLRAVYTATRKHGTTGTELDLALLVDGLQAEREQGITIDVAYRYFSTPRRKFIIADTPGHEQYTRNMATGASTSDVAVILVDATLGVLDQTRRHAFIATLLGVQHIVVAVNKMDLVGWSETTFRNIRDDFSDFAARLQVADIQFIPLSALLGDNVVHSSERMPWYAGGPLLDHLETLHIAGDRNLIDFRLPVQLVVRPNAEFRGYAGSVASGVLRRNQEVLVLPSGQRTRVRSILTPRGESDSAVAPLPVTVTLEDDIDVSRGDMLAYPNNAPHVDRAFEAMLVWMNDTPLVEGREYLLKQTTNVVPATVTAVRYRMNVKTLHREAAAESLALNEIGRVRVETPRLLAFDPYTRNRVTGAFILVDRLNYATIAAGMILDRDAAEEAHAPVTVAPSPAAGPGPEEWTRRLGQKGLFITMSGGGATGVAAELRDFLFRRGFLAEVLSPEAIGALDTQALGSYLRRLGVICIAADSTAPGPLVVTCDDLVIAGRDAESIYANLAELALLQEVR